jgi:nucleoside-diphosphate-sugar epimerase
VQPSDLQAADGDPPTVRADVLSENEMENLCAGAEAVVHLACASWDEELSAADNETRIMDTRLKGTYNLMKAAAAAGVKRVVQVSDLCVYSGYGEDIVVSEDFLPLPDCSAPEQSVYLSELIGREFSRLHPGLVLTLRLGQLTAQAGVEADGDDGECLAIDDAVEGIARALEVDGYDGLSHWGIYNLAAERPGSRYSLLKISSGRFGFRPGQSVAGEDR